MRSIALDPQLRHRPPEALEPNYENTSPIDLYEALFIERRHNAGHLEQGLSLESEKAAPPQIQRGHNRGDSGELHLLRHVTRDSMVDNMLRSFNQMPYGEGPYPNHEPFHSSFQNGKLAEPLSEYAHAPSRPIHEDSRASLLLSSDSDLRSEEDFNLVDTLKAHRRSKYSGDIKRLSTESVISESNGKESLTHVSPSGAPKLTAGTLNMVDIPGEEKYFISPPQSPNQVHMYSNAATTRCSTEQETIRGEERDLLGRSSHSSSFNFDPHLNDRQRRHSRSSVLPSSILGRARPVPGDYHDFDETPNPNIPNKDRNMTSVSSSPDRSFGPRQPNLSSTPTSPARGRTKARKGARGTGLPSTKSENLLIGDRGNNATTTNPLRHVAKQFEGVERSEPTTPVPPMERHASTDSVKERPGFFRRVFSSPRVLVVTAAEAPQLPPLDVAGRNDSNGSSKFIKSIQHTSQSLSTHSPAPPDHLPFDLTQVLNKKSSFFRRRKKTVIDKVYHHSGTNRDTSTTTPQASRSISSLRQVMDPFLSDAVSPLDQDNCFDDSEHQFTDISDDVNLHSLEFSFRDTLSQKGNLRRLGSASLMNPDSSASQLSYGPRPLVSLQREMVVGTDVERNHIVDRKSPLPHESNDMEDRSGRSTPSSVVERISDLRRHKIKPVPSSMTNLPSRQMENQGCPRSSGNKEAAVRTGPAKVQARRMPEKLYLRNNLLYNNNDDGFIVANPIRKEMSSKTGSDRSNRVWLNQTDSDEIQWIDPGRVLLLHGELADYTTSALAPSDEADTLAVAVLALQSQPNPPPVAVEAVSDLDTFTAENIEQAKMTFDGHDDPDSQAKAVFFLGKEGLSGDRARQAYMALYDFSGLNILLALRDLCGRLALKGETQQVDRVLSSFSQRWCECNPHHGFKTEDVVHTICYSLLLLNTDLHLANLDQKMTRSQFIRNVVPTIRRAAKEELIDKDATIRPRKFPVHGSLPSRDGQSPSPLSSPLGFEVGNRRPSIDVRDSNSRVPSRQRFRVSSDVALVPSPTPDGSRTLDVCDALVNGPFDDGKRSWESVVENVLKEFYFSIRHQCLPLHGASEGLVHEQPSNSSLSVMGGVIRRTGSMISKTPSDSKRVRNNDFRSVGNRWNRSRAKLPYQASTLGSSRTSLEEASLWSPSPSSTWSKSNLSKAHSTMSSDSLSSHVTHGDYGYQQSIGFANALSHAIIREESSNNVDNFEKITPLLEDNTLEMAAPWAKDGIVQHKQHLDMTDKKSKDRSWRECFAVVEKGWIRLFSFNSRASARTQKNKAARGGVVGGGNWTENAEALGSFMLRQTVANIMPPPGYSKARPHVFALSLPTGAVHLFQAGTAEIVKEFVSTTNYWSARLSKEPLVGGVSNVEYGWSDQVINSPTLRIGTGHSNHSGLHSLTSPYSLTISGRPSFQGSACNSFEQSGNVRSRLPGDRIALSDWSPPQQSLMASKLGEGQQLEALKQYVRDVEVDLSRHNELRGAMLAVFSPRQPNANKAMSNWERKSSYLLREIVKFRTYVDSLNAARDEKDRLQRERARAASLAHASPEADRHAALTALPQRSGTPVDPWVL